MDRLQEKYQQKIAPVLQKELNIKNRLAAPKVEKVVVNMGIGDTVHDKTKREKAISTMSLITGQRPLKKQAKKAISEFRIRQGDVVGLTTTLRGRRMYEFLDRLISIVLPRIRDFQGVKTTAFDQQANYSLGLAEQTVFSEVEYDKIDRVRGLEISIITSVNDQTVARRLLELLGLPFAKEADRDRMGRKD
jgi:large subunit ribosomal protein L5